MKKYLLTFLIALLIGFFLANFFINQYDSYEGIKVSNSGESLYFIQYGVFSNKESMENQTISLENYVYNEEGGLFYVYVGITKDKSNALKIVEFYKSLGYETLIKEYSITNKTFLELINNYDEILKQTNDKSATSSVLNQVLMKYEEVVINGG